MAENMDRQKSFEDIWASRKERIYSHWCKGEPRTQIQLAFRNHWLTFQEIMQNPIFNKGNRCLEIGCGRGSLSCYFSEAGYDCTLVDISPSIIDTAREIFRQNNLQAKFVVADAYRLPFADQSFDIVFSIGLLEHFTDVKNIITEQLRVINRGGLFIGYVVPEKTSGVQEQYAWINEVLKGYAAADRGGNQIVKDIVYRSDFGAFYYVTLLQEMGLRDIRASGIYSLPMISHSIDFPFTLMPPQSEAALTVYFNEILEKRRRETQGNPWLCEESYGQAFLVWGIK